VVTGGPRPTIQLQRQTGSLDGEKALKGKRSVYFPEYKGFVDCPVYDRYRMGPGIKLDGPVIVEEKESTLVVGPGGKLRIDGYLNAIVEFTT
jgi:N-methylhydantoinase A